MPTKRNRSDLFRERSRDMRQQPNDAEATVWNAVRNRKLGGFKFRRQYPLGIYIADFYCAEARLIIELDGQTHADRQQYDSARDAWMASQGLAVLRFENLDVHESLEGFLEVVRRKCVERSGEITRSTGPSP